MKSMLIKAGRVSKEALIIDTALPAEVPGLSVGLSEAMRALVKQAGQIKVMLENGQKEECQRFLERMDSVALSALCMREGLVRELYFAVALPLLSFLNENGLSHVIGEHACLDHLANLESHANWNNAVGYLAGICRRIFEHSRDEGQDNTEKLIKFVKRYVDENIGGDLSLSCISGLLHFNPSYFSRMFKSATETGYKEYVDGVKTVRAKELLAGTAMTVNEIAVRLGFDAPSNFSRFFKRQAGLSPQDYRDAAQDQGA